MLLINLLLLVLAEQPFAPVAVASESSETPPGVEGEGGAREQPLPRRWNHVTALRLAKSWF